MSPHAIPYSPASSVGSTPSDAGSIASNEGLKSHLRRFDDDETHDLICIGFGPASLAIAVALHDTLDTGRAQNPPKVRFLEQQTQFRWHAGMLLPGAKMQISFMKDMATLRNPRSAFTFVNYLHAHDRLVAFTNLGTFLPQRIEYEHYMKWCAAHFEDVVDYSHTAAAVRVASRTPSGSVDSFEVISRDAATGQISKLRTRNVVVAAGGRPNIPLSLQPRGNSPHPRIIHSSQYATYVPTLPSSGSGAPRSIAVIGAGQSAAEVFNNLPSIFPSAKVSLLIRGAALRPSDDSPFVNEVFNPERVDSVYASDPKLRAAQIKLDKATNYSVVRLELLEHIYGVLYANRIQYGDDESAWPQRIRTQKDVLGVQDVVADGRECLRLALRNTSGFEAGIESAANSFTDADETLDADLVIVATGYRRDAHEEILQEDVRALLSASPAPVWPVSRDYSIKFAPGAVSTGSGVYLQGCNEKTHGLSDTLLSILAVRGGEMVESIFGDKKAVASPVELANSKQTSAHVLKQQHEQVMTL